MLSNEVTLLGIMVKVKVSLRALRGNLNKWNGLKVSLRALRGNLIRKMHFFLRDCHATLAMTLTSYEIASLRSQ